jgi:chitin synthase
VQIALSGAITGAHFSLSNSGIDTQNGLLQIPAKEGYRAFDVFYYLLSAASTAAEREGLGLMNPENYMLLARSNTYSLPSHLPTADDSAAAEDWRSNLRSIGIRGSALRGLLSVLAGILKLGNSVGLLVDAEVVEEVCDDVSGLLGIDAEVLAKKMGDSERELFISIVYELLVEWVISKANDAMTADFIATKEAQSSAGGSQDGDTVQISILELPNEKMARALCLKGVFDDDSGLNVEMKTDGIEIPACSNTIVREIRTTWSDAEKDCLIGLSREREYENDRRENTIEKCGREIEEGGFLKEILFPDDFGRPPANVRIDVSQLLSASRAWYHLSITPSDDVNPKQSQQWSAAAVSRQLRSWRLPEWANRRLKRLDFTADFDFDEFETRYSILGCSGGREGVQSWVLERGWSNGEVVVGKERVWMREPCWWESESMLDIKQPGVPPGLMGMAPGAMNAGFTANHNGSGFFPQAGGHGLDSVPLRETLVQRQQSTLSANRGLRGGSHQPAADDQNAGLLAKYEANHYIAPGDVEMDGKKHIEEQPTTRSRKIWAGFVWAMTFWIPSFLLRYIGRMKRPDVRMAWREKFVLVFLIFLLNAGIIFWIAIFARLLCPNIDKAWSRANVALHQGTDDFWVSIRGNVYDISQYSPLTSAF